MMQMFFVFSGCIIFSLLAFILQQADTTFKKPYSVTDARQSEEDNTNSDVNAYLSIKQEPGTTERSLEKISTNNSQRRNVLFIIVDGLRPQLGAYHDPDNPDYFGKVKIQTPNLDRLASKSMVFRQAFVQFSLCGPSRTSILTSRRPDLTGVYSNHAYWRVVGGNFTTLPQHFKNNGYWTVGLGKVFHVRETRTFDDSLSWSEPCYQPPHTDREFRTNGFKESWANVSGREGGRALLMDESTTEMAKAILRNVSEKTRTGKQYFFMAVGYNKPHQRFVCPDQYYALYQLESDGQFLANESWQNLVLDTSKDMQGSEIKDGRRILPPDVLRRLRRAYFACVSYIDGLVGELIRELVDCGLYDKTVVSFVADHGFHLGENGHWGKNAIWDIANRVPMMLRIPGVTDSGLTSTSVVEALDLFPTIVEAAGLDPVPRCPADSAQVQLCTEGVSLMPLFQKGDYEIKTAAFSQIVQPSHMLYTMRTRQFRLVDCVAFGNSTRPGSESNQDSEWPLNTTCTKLYDHNKDILEQVNLAEDPKYFDIINDLRRQLHQFVESQFKIS